MLLGNVQKKWQQTPSAMDNSVGANGLLVSIMKLEMSVNFCPTLIEYAVWLWRRLYLSELNKCIHLKSIFYGSVVIQYQPHLLNYWNFTEPTVITFFLGLFPSHLYTKQRDNQPLNWLPLRLFQCDCKPFAEPTYSVYIIEVNPWCQ